MNTMLRGENPKTERFMNLAGDLQTDLKNLIKKEFELAKTEMGEKLKIMGRNAIFAAAGGVLALMAIFLLFLGIGAIIAQILLKAGMSAGTAYFVAYMGFGLILAIIGYLLIQKAIHAFSAVSLTPEKTLDTVKTPESVAVARKHLHEHDHEHKTKSDSKPAPSSDELKTEVMATRHRMESEMSELKARLKPGYMAKSLGTGLKHHPLTTLLFGAGTSLGGYLYWRKRHHIAAARSLAHSARRGIKWRVRRA
jgi:hypothetical protein